MTAAAWRACLFGLGMVVASTAGPALAAGAPLLVVVEAPPTLDVDASEIRRAIGAELQVETVAPNKTALAPPERALIVAIDRERIAMSLRTNEGVPVVRSIAAPFDRAARLRAIAWLAGNLARDQVTPIVEQSPPAPSPLATIPALPAPEVATAPPQAAATEPPPQPPAPFETATPTISVRAARSRPTVPSLWSVSAAIGPAIAYLWKINGQPGVLSLAPLDYVTAWQLDVERRREHDRLIFGATLEGTYSHGANGDGPQLIGANAFVGANWRPRSFSLEATIGAGVEAAEVSVFQPFTVTTASGTQIYPGYYDVYRLDGYAQATLVAAMPVSASVEVLLRVGVHMNAFRDEDWFATTTLGLRYTLP